MCHVTMVVVKAAAMLLALVVVLKVSEEVWILACALASLVGGLLSTLAAEALEMGLMMRLDLLLLVMVLAGAFFVWLG